MNQEDQWWYVGNDWVIFLDLTSKNIGLGVVSRVLCDTGKFEGFIRAMLRINLLILYVLNNLSN